MDSDRNHSSIDGGQPAERQPLLPSPLSTNGHPDRITADSTEASAAEDSGTNTLLESRMKLGASALNFFLSGIAMAAVGVGITAHACSLDAR
jgi:hypothetical protein